MCEKLARTVTHVNREPRQEMGGRMGAVRKEKSALCEPERTQGNWLVSILLLLIGFSAMFVVMWMTGRFGWSLRDDPADRFASAMLHVLADAAAAVLATTI